MAANASLAFKILAIDAASGKLAKIGKEIEKTGKRASVMGKTTHAALSVLKAGALGAGVAAAGLFKAGISDAIAYQQVQAQTAAAIKSTGNVAHISVKGVAALAGKLESLSGVDENLIIGSQNLLASFTKVHNEVGKGNDIFNQATKAALDLSIGTGTDLRSATLQLGKALNDPIQGMTALQRSGVSFSATQKKAIAAMQESGNVAGAQKLILGELNKEFGGRAEAAGKGFTGSWARAKDALADAARDLATQLLPTLTRLSDWVTNTGVPALRNIASWFKDHRQLIGEIASKLKGLLIPALVAFGVAATVAAASAAKAFLAGLGPIGLIAAVIAVVVVEVVKHWGQIKHAASAVWNWIKGHWPLLLAIITGPIGIAVLVVKRHWDSIKGAATKAFDGIKGAASAVGRAIAGAFKAAFNGISSAWNSTVGKLSFHVPGWVPGLGGKGWDVPDLPHFARGGDFSGLAVVGEQGPEIIAGSGHVFSNRQSRGMLGNVTYNVYGSNPALIAAEIAKEHAWAFKTAGV